MGDLRLDPAVTGRLGPKAGHAMASGGTHVTPAVLHTLSAPVQDAFKSGITSGVHGTMIGGAVPAFLGFVVAFLVREVPLRGDRSPAPAADPVQEEPLADPVV